MTEAELWELLNAYNDSGMTALTLYLTVVSSSLSDSDPGRHDLKIQCATGLSGRHLEQVITPRQPGEPPSRLYSAL